MRRLPLLIVIIVAILFRVTSALYVGAEAVSFGDGPDYIEAAIRICVFHSYPHESALPFFRAPGLPFFLSLFTGCNPQFIFLDKLILILADCCSVLLIGLLAVRVWKDDSLLIPAALLAAVYPPFIAQVTDIQSEPLFMALLLEAIYLLLGSGSNRRKFLLSGVFLGLSALTRPVGLVFLPLFCAVLLFGSSDNNLKKRLFGALLFSCGFFTAIAPWAVRNAIVYNDLILVNDAGGYNFWRGAHPEMREIYQASSLEEFTRQQQHFETVTSPTVAAEVAAKITGPGERSAKWQKLGTDIVKQDPSSYLKFLGQKALIYWRPWLNPTVNPISKVILSALIFGPALVLGFIGLARLRQHSSALFWSCVLFLGISWMAQVPFQVVLRFRIPIVDPICLILGIQPLMAMVKSWTWRTSPK